MVEKSKFENNNLYGCVERVHLEKELVRNYARGRLLLGQGRSNLDVPVRHGALYVGQECLVRFDLRKHYAELDLAANFLTAKVPNNFTGLANSQYILCARWEPEMKQIGSVPNLEEIQRYFNPGHCKTVYFLQNGSSNRKGRKRVTCYGTFPHNDMSISQIIRKGLPNPNNFARMIVGESESEMEKIIKGVKEQNLIPIEMEPLLL